MLNVHLLGASIGHSVAAKVRKQVLKIGWQALVQAIGKGLPTSSGFLYLIA